jgi:hypothetical protein
MVAFLKAALGLLATDRTVHIGGAASAFAVITSASAQSIDLWLGIATKGLGFLVGLGTLIHLCLKIRGELKKPKALD